MLDVIIVSANDVLIWLIFHGGIDLVSQIGPTRGRSGRNQSNYLQLFSRVVLTCSLQVFLFDVAFLMF